MLNLVVDCMVSRPKTYGNYEFQLVICIDHWLYNEIDKSL